MLVEPAIMLADALASDVYGVNVQLRTLEHYPEHGPPTPVLRVLDPFRNDEVQTESFGTDLPALVVSLPTQFDLEGDPRSGGRGTDDLIGLRLGVLYVQDSQIAQTAIGDRAAAYTVRAIMRTITEWMSNDRAAERVVHGLQVRDWVRTTIAPAAQPLESGRVVGSAAVFVDITVRDVLP